MDIGNNRSCHGFGKGFSDLTSIEENLPIVNVIYAYNHPETGEVILPVINHCIYLGNNKVNLIACPNQMQLHGVYINVVNIHLLIRVPCNKPKNKNKAQLCI